MTKNKWFDAKEYLPSRAGAGSDFSFPCTLLLSTESFKHIVEAKYYYSGKYWTPATDFYLYNLTEYGEAVAWTWGKPQNVTTTLHTALYKINPNRVKKIPLINSQPLPDGFYPTPGDIVDMPASYAPFMNLPDIPKKFLEGDIPEKDATPKQLAFIDKICITLKIQNPEIKKVKTANRFIKENILKYLQQTGSLLTLDSHNKLTSLWGEFKRIHGCYSSDPSGTWFDYNSFEKYEEEANRIFPNKMNTPQKIGGYGYLENFIYDKDLYKKYIINL